MPTIDQSALQHAQRVADAVANLPGVVGITLGGSVASGMADAASDLDLHVYWRAPLAEPEQRAERLRPLADAGSLDINRMTWCMEDGFRVSGRAAELIYVNLDDLGSDIDRAYGEGLRDEGFVTVQFYYLDLGRMLHDATGELTALQPRLRASYPEPTRRQLLADNPLRLCVYIKQLCTAQSRGDLLYVQHRRYTIQMVFFNLLFALNRLYHPGEKRLLIHAQRCAMQPPRMDARWNDVARLAADDPALADALQSLIDDLCTLVEEHR